MDHFKLIPFLLCLSGCGGDIPFGGGVKTPSSIGLNKRELGHVW